MTADEMALSLKFRANSPLTRMPHASMMTNFSPAAWPDGTPSSANGDGNFVYPCPAGPCSTIRLKNIRDGIEDWELLSRLGAEDKSRLITTLVANGTHRVEDPVLLESTRREAARLLIAAQRPGHS